VYVRAKPLTVGEKAAGLQPVVRCESDSRVSLTFQGAPKVPALLLCCTGFWPPCWQNPLPALCGVTPHAQSPAHELLGCSPREAEL
jgi:hypothetical protein